MSKSINTPVHIIGGGLAGSEAAWQLLKRDIPVIMHEMRPTQKTFAHITNNLAELVCSNSFRSDDHSENAVGLLHHELRALDSLIMKAADAHQVPAGSALAVDREGFSSYVQETLMKHPLFTLERQEIEDLESIDRDHVIVSTGPLTSTKLSESIKILKCHVHLAFF
ncbi:MAG: FAD-dependent oxidoreductase, partial [Alphaproteobacteria bacterium]|nr:FAD-dependent oxidoreductase [Alphaproteobacteria bacterium]